MTKIFKENNLDDLEAFFKKVLVMRASQREYFRTRQPDVLRKAKALEAEVDKLLKDMPRLNDASQLSMEFLGL